MNRPAQEPDSRRHDQTSKLLFSHPPAATDLVRDFAAKGWVHGLDLRAVEAFPTESVSADLKRRLGDCAWRVWFKGRRASVVFLVEFQSSVDHEMVFRTMDYSHGAHLVFHRNPGMLDPGGAMPHIVSVVVYSGGQPWSAVPTLAQLARRRTPSLPEVARGLGGEWQHSHGHRVLDLQAAFAQDLLPEDSLLAWLAAMEKAPWTSLPSVRRSLAKRWGGPAHSDVRRALSVWVDERLRVARGPEERRRQAVQWIIQPKEQDHMSETYDDWARGHEERGRERGRAEGRAEGRVEGRVEGRAEGRTEQGRSMVLRLASRRFGAETARELKGLVEGMGAKELTRVGDAVVDSDTGDELLETAGNGAAEQRSR